MTTLRYILYARKSSEDAERQSLSVPAQIRKINELFPDVNIVAVREESRSAFEPGRPVFAEVLSMIQDGKAEGILAWHPDRLSRNEIDAATITYAIRRGTIKDLRFGSYYFVNSPDGIMMLQTIMSQSQYYSAKLSVDVKRGNEEQRKRGWLTYVAIPGYLNARNPNNPDQGMIVVDEERFVLVRKMWDMLLSGGYSVPMIQRIANEEWHYLSPKRRRLGGRPLHRNTLYSMFINIRYAGLIPVPGSDEEFEKAAYPAMITLGEFDRAQQILGNRGKPRQAVSKEFAYRGFLFCKQCGCQITAEDKLKRQKNGTIHHYTYYHCTHRRPCNNRKAVEERDLAEQLYSMLDSYTIDPLLEEWALEAIKDLGAGETEEQEALQKAQRSTLEQLRKQYDKLVDMASKELIEEETFKEKSEGLIGHIKELEEDTVAAKLRGSLWRSGLRKIIDVLAHGRERFESGDIMVKRNVLLALGSDPTLDDGKVELTPYEWLIPIRDALPQLRVELGNVRTAQQQISAESRTGVIARVLSTWLAILGEARTLLEVSPTAGKYVAESGTQTPPTTQPSDCDPEVAGLPHNGKIGKREQEYVRASLDEVNTHRAAAGHTTVNPSSPVDAER